MKLVSLRKLLVTTAVSGLAFGAMAANASAGEVPSLAAPLQILKTVSGPVPAGTTFTVNVHCPDGNIDTGADEATATITDTDATVTFDAAGQPTSPDIIGFDNEGTCTVTETGSGGAASVSYACAGTIPPVDVIKGFGDQPTSQAEVPTDPCSAAGPQAEPISVFIVDESQEAAVTVHNTFADPTPPPTPAAQVVAQPAFTG